jgi:hypothetical protein
MPWSVAAFPIHATGLRPTCPTSSNLHRESDRRRRPSGLSGRQPTLARFFVDPFPPITGQGGIPTVRMHNLVRASGPDVACPTAEDKCAGTRFRAPALTFIFEWRRRDSNPRTS